MKFILISLLFVLSLNADISFEDDKKKHFIISAPFGALGEVIVHSYNITGTNKILYATVIGLIPGMAKEIYDEHSYGGFDKYDLFYNTLGSFAGAITTYYFINWIIEPQEKQLKISYKIKF